MTTDTVLIVVGATVFALGMLSTVIKHLWLSVALLALLTGVALGPVGFELLHPAELREEHKTLEELARITLAVSLVALGLQFQRPDLHENWKRGLSLLTAGMVGMWLMTSLGAGLLLGLDFWLALLVGGILTPTDPVVASSLVSGRLAEKNIPRWVRRSLQLESGANDGLALVFVLVPALVLTLPGDPAASIAGEVARQVAVAAAGGLATGYAAAKLVDYAEEHEAVSEGFFLISALALALLTLGSVHALGGTGVLASFIAGVTFSLSLGERYAEELEQMQDALQKLLIVPVFVFFGAILPWDAWTALGWSGLAFAAWVLLLRRPPVVALALSLGPGKTPRRATAFLSWYGPIGVSGIYYALFIERYGFDEFERIFAACTLAILASVMVHSITATPGVRGYAGRRPQTTLRHPLTPGIDEAP